MKATPWRILTAFLTMLSVVTFGLVGPAAAWHIDDSESNASLSCADGEAAVGFQRYTLNAEIVEPQNNWNPNNLPMSIDNYQVSVNGTVDSQYSVNWVRDGAGSGATLNATQDWSLRPGETIILAGTVEWKNGNNVVVDSDTFSFTMIAPTDCNLPSGDIDINSQACEAIDYTVSLSNVDGLSVSLELTDDATGLAVPNVILATPEDGVPYVLNNLPAGDYTLTLKIGETIASKEGVTVAECVGVPNVTAQINVLCNDESPGTVYIQAVITNTGNADGEYLFGSDNGAGPDIAWQSGTIAPLTSVTLYAYPDALGSGNVFVRDGIVPGSGNSVIAQASFDSDDCTPTPEPVAPIIEFKCVGEDLVAYTVTNPNDFGALNVWVGGEVTSDVTGVIATGTEVQASVTEGDVVSEFADVRAPECEPDNEPVEALVTFVCEAEGAVRYTVTSDAYGLAVEIDGQDANLSGVVAPGTEVKVTTYTLSKYSDEFIVWTDTFTASECDAEVTPAATISTVCDADFATSYTVTPAEGTTITAVYVNGVSRALGGEVNPGDVIVAEFTADGIYTDTVSGSVTYTVPNCELPFTGAETNLIAGFGLAILAAGAALVLFARRRDVA